MFRLAPEKDEGFDGSEIKVVAWFSGASKAAKLAISNGRAVDGRLLLEGFLPDLLRLLVSVIPFLNVLVIPFHTKIFLPAF